MAKPTITNNLPPEMASTLRRVSQEGKALREELKEARDSLDSRLMHAHRDLHASYGELAYVTGMTISNVRKSIQRYLDTPREWD